MSYSVWLTGVAGLYVKVCQSFYSQTDLRQGSPAELMDTTDIAGAAGCASVLISFRFIGSAPEVLTTASIIPTNQDGTYRLQLHRSASRQLSGKVKMHTQNKFFVKLTRALNRMKPL